MTTWAPLVLSVEIATVATLVAVVLGTALAVVLAWRRLPLPSVVAALVSTPLVLPPTVLGYYLLVALGPHSAVGRAWHAVFGADIAFTFTGAVVAGVVGSLPLVVGAVRVGIDAIDPDLALAARTLGARPLRVLATITLPLAAPAIAAGAMLGFARALGDYGMTLMIASERFDGLFGLRDTSPASIYVYNELATLGHQDAARDMALATTVLGVALLVAANRINQRLTRKLRRG